MPAGWPLKPGCRSQISSGTIGASTCSGRDCRSLKPLSSIAHSISTGPPASCSHLRNRRPSVTAWPRRKARLAHQVLRAPARGAATPCAQVSRWPLRPACHGAQEAVLGEHDAVGHHLALRDRRAEAPGGGDQHLAFGGLAQAAAGGARRDQRLDQHAHRRVGRRQIMILHVAARMRGPQRRPAGAHRGEEFGFVGEAEEALELAGEIGAFAVLDQRRGAHRAERRVGALRAPGREQRLEDFGRDRLFVERQPDLHRQLARGRQIGLVVLAQPNPRCRDGAPDDDRRRR